jgi:glycosyltransferase involved in cell wall biosynthesis
MPEVLASVPDAELVIAGTGDAKDGLAAYARELGVSSRVSFEGFVDERRKAALMASSWVFAMPSEMEGWGLTIIEANACGTPAVGFPVPGVGEAIVDGVSGLLVEDADSLAPVIVRVLHDERLRAELSRGAVMRAGEFSWDRATDVILESLRVEGSRSHTSMLLSNDGYSVVPHRRLSVALNVDSIPHNNGKLVNNRREAV